MPHPCSGKGDRVRRIVIGVECVWGRGQWLIPYIIMVICRRERGAAIALPSMGMVPHQAKS